MRPRREPVTDVTPRVSRTTAQPGLIVIGSGPAGVSAAEAFRAHNGDVPVRILTADSDLPYARPR